MAQQTNYLPTHLVIGLLLVVFQSTIFAKIGGLNFLPVLLIHLALQQSFLSGSSIVFLLGFFFGVLSGAPVGLHCILFLIIYYLVYLIHQWLNLFHPVHQIVTVFLGLSFLNIANNYAWSGTLTFSSNWMAIAIVALVTPFCFRIFELCQILQVKIVGYFSTEKP